MYKYQKTIFKQIEKNALDLITVLLKDDSITIDIVPQLDFFFDLSRGDTPFCKNKSLQKLDPSCNSFVLNLESAQVQTNLQVNIWVSKQ